jgi:hypothetical protein
MFESHEPLEKLRTNERSWTCKLAPTFESAVRIFLKFICPPLKQEKHVNEFQSDGKIATVSRTCRARRRDDDDLECGE